MKMFGFILFLNLAFLPQAWSYGNAQQERSSLRQDIRHLKQKIRSSKKGVSQNDLQKLTELENKLEKTDFLKKKAHRR